LVQILKLIIFSLLFLLSCGKPGSDAVPDPDLSGIVKGPEVVLLPVNYLYDGLNNKLGEYENHGSIGLLTLADKTLIPIDIETGEVSASIAYMPGEGLNVFNQIICHYILPNCGGDCFVVGKLFTNEIVSGYRTINKSNGQELNEGRLQIKSDFRDGECESNSDTLDYSFRIRTTYVIPNTLRFPLTLSLTISN
jgi:hypothetical protein